MDPYGGVRMYPHAYHSPNGDILFMAERKLPEGINAYIADVQFPDIPDRPTLYSIGKTPEDALNNLRGFIARFYPRQPYIIHSLSSTDEPVYIYDSAKAP